MIVNKKQLLRKAPIKDMLDTSKRVFGRSYGLSHAGYDIRLKQSILFIPKGMHAFGMSFNEDTVVLDGIPIGGRFTLASAIEEFDMPNDLVGIVHDKSTNARLGISVFNTVIESCWKGFLTLEIVFHGNEPIELPAGTPIAQVIFHSLTECSEYTGKYQGQKDEPTKAIFEKEKE